MQEIGLYALKPWYGRRLAGIRTSLADRGVSPDLVTAAGVVAGGAAGLAVAGLRHGVVAGLLVGVLLALRLACANLDGGLARDLGRTSPRGSVLNEVGDRAAELAVLAGCLAVAPAWLVAATAVAASAPSWVALAGAAAGRQRVQGGPVGKTERAALLVILAATGAAVPLLAVIAVGSLATAAFRLRKVVAR
jgi:CDP-diacylglycerol---glycerol-3-phosphate 3-phosphatidyltransferase